ncbi:calcium/sodium antiporter [Haloactinopolyspora sp.]|uniref:calcium/sodium antiporter n=1 Tax=Haloactinopolyspora sp. TaxID=1966353 RepID=UPI00261A0CD5|nr:calcium/sodium antiporter [Haloactinopolyspora sp.]
METGLLIVVGLTALVGGAELLIRGGSRVASRLGISPIAVGLTFVSIGTSAPELAVGIDAGLQGNGGLVVGNIAGTNVVNVLLILGLSAAIRALPLDSVTLRLDLPMMASAAVILLLLAIDGVLSTADGIILLFVAVAYTALIVKNSKRESPRVQAEYAEEYTVPAGRLAATRDVAVLVTGTVVIVVGADWLVSGAVDLAVALDVSNALIGLTVVAIGTSAPELATTIVSTIRGDRDIAIGNLIGSSVYNIGLILGTTAVVVPGRFDLSAPLTYVDIPIMTGVALLCVPMFVVGAKITRTEGVACVAAYGVYLAYLVFLRT